MINLSERDLQWVEETWTRVCTKMEDQCGRIGTKVPYTLVNGRHNDMLAENLYWWTNGFWPGMLWQMYHA